MSYRWEVFSRRIPLETGKPSSFVTVRLLVLKVAWKLHHNAACCVHFIHYFIVYMRWRVSPRSAFVRFSDFSSVTKYPGVKFLSVSLCLTLLHIHKWAVTKRKKKKKTYTLKQPISEAYGTCVFVWGTEFLAFWRQDRLGFLWTPKQPRLGPAQCWVSLCSRFIWITLKLLMLIFPLAESHPEKSALVLHFKSCWTAISYRQK